MPLTNPPVAVSLSGNTAGALALVSTGTLYLAGGANITLSQNGNSVSISGGAGGGGGSVNISAGTTSQNLTNLVFSNGSGVTFGLNGSTITASVAAVGGAQTGISGIIVSDASYTSGTVSFSNQANITIGSSVNGATQYIRLSGNAAQTTQSAIKAFGVSNTGQTAGNTGVSTGVDWVLAGSQSLTLSQSTVGGGPNTIWLQHPAWLTTAMQSNAATISNVNVSAGTTSQNLSNVVFSNGNGVSFGLNGSTVTASVAAAGGAQTGISGIIVSDATYTSGTVSFSNAGNITISSSVNGATQYIRLSGNAAQTTQSAIKAFGASNTGNTAGNTGVSTGIDWVVAGTNNITVSESTAGGGPNTLWISGPTTAAVTLTAYATSNTTQSSTGTLPASSLIFAGAGIASVGVSNGSIVISVPSGGGAGDGGVFAGVSNLGNTAGSTGTVSTGNLVLVGSQGITLSQSTGAAGSAATITIQGYPILSYYEPAIRGGTTTSIFPQTSVQAQPFVVSQPVTMYRMGWAHQATSQSLTTMSVSGSVSAGSASSGTGSFGQSGTYLLLSRLSTGTDASSSVIQTFYSNSTSYSVGHSVSVSWSTNASSATVSWTTSGKIGWLGSVDSAGGGTTTSSGTSGSSSFSSTSTNANSFSSSFSMSFASAHLSNIRQWMMPLATSLSPGEYWLAHVQSSATGSTNYSLQRLCVVTGGILGFTTANNGFARIGSSATMNSSHFYQGWGSHSASSQTTTTMRLDQFSMGTQPIQTWFQLMAWVS